MITNRFIFTLILVSLSTPLLGQRQPMLVKAVLYLHTRENKARITDSVSVEVKTESRLLAHTIIMLNKEIINTKRDHQIDLGIDAKGIEKDACLGYSVNILNGFAKQRAWKFDARVEFYFSDGYIIAADEANISLDREAHSIKFHSF